MMNSRKGTIISILVTVLLTIGGVYVMNNHYYERFDKSEPPELPLSPELLEDFEGLLNGFLREVDQGVFDYKKERQVLVEMLKPDSLRFPEYVAENYDTAGQIVLSLNKRMDAVLGMFSAADQKVKDRLLQEPESSRDRILARWDNLVLTHGGFYQVYFANEKEMLGVYLELMEFYYQKRMEFGVDVDMDKIVFKNPDDEKMQSRLRQRIADIQKKQKSLFVKANAAP